MPMCDKTITVAGSTNEELQAACNTQCEEACGAPAPATTRAPLAISHKMDKETFYTIMGWDSDTVHPWQRWGLVGPQMTPPAGSDLLAYIIVLLVFVILGVWAAVRSWKFNSRGVYNGVKNGYVRPPTKNVHPVTKFVYAVVAFYFGPIYLLIEAISDRQMIHQVLADQKIFPRLEPYGTGTGMAQL